MIESSSSQLLSRRKRLQDAILTLQKRQRETKASLHALAGELQEVDTALRGCVAEEEKADGMRPGSRRFVSLLRRTELEHKYRLTEAPIRCFEEHFKLASSVCGDDPDAESDVADPALISSAILACGGGSVVLKQLVELWDSDPALELMMPESERVLRRGMAIEQGLELVKMGLATPPAFAEVFGGCMDLSTKSLRELRDMASEIGVTLSYRSGGKRWKKSIEELRQACLPLLTLSRPNLTLWRDYRARRSVLHAEYDRAKCRHRLIGIESLPGRDAATEHAVNQLMMARRDCTASRMDRVVDELGMGFLPASHPARFRPSLLEHLVRQLAVDPLDPLDPLAASVTDVLDVTRPPPPLEQRLSTEAFEMWIAGEQREARALQQVFA